MINYDFIALTVFAGVLVLLVSTVFYDSDQ